MTRDTEPNLPAAHPHPHPARLTTLIAHLVRAIQDSGRPVDSELEAITVRYRAMAPSRRKPSGEYRAPPGGMFPDPSDRSDE